MTMRKVSASEISPMYQDNIKAHQNEAPIQILANGSPNVSRRSFRVKAALGIVALSLSACTNITPEALSEEEMRTQAQATLAALEADVDTIPAQLTLNEALARGLKFNLDRRAKMMEEAIAFQVLDVTQYDMLPKLVAQAGYSWRDNNNISQSVNADTGQPSQSRFISQERSSTVSSLALTWSILDMGVGYYASRQQADRVLIAAERRRKAMHLLMQDIRTAYWRAVSAQKLMSEVTRTIRMAEGALADSRRVSDERVSNPLDALRYQRQLLENLRLLESIAQELSSAEVELASLINAPIGKKLKLVEPSKSVDRRALSVPLQVMEETAMVANPDLREQIYNVRIASEETRSTLMRLFPNITFNYGANYDTDKFLLNNDWRDAGAQISFNLFNLFTGPNQMKLAEAGVRLADQRRVAMQMAIVTQVHLARQEYQNSLQQLSRADAIWQTDRNIAKITSERADAALQGSLERVANQTTSILSQLRRYQALAQAQAAEARLQATVGIDPEIGSVGEASLSELTSQLGQGDDVWRKLAANGGSQ